MLSEVKKGIGTSLVMNRVLISDRTNKEFLNQEVITIEVIEARAEIEVLSLEDEKEEDWITATKSDNSGEACCPPVVQLVEPRFYSW